MGAVLSGYSLYADSQSLSQDKVKQIFAGKKKEKKKKLFVSGGSPVVTTESAVNKLFKSFEDERREELERIAKEKARKAKEEAERKARVAKEKAAKARAEAEKKQLKKSGNYGLSAKMVSEYIKKGHTAEEARKVSRKEKSSYKPVRFNLVVLGFIKKGSQVSLMTNIGTLVAGGKIRPTGEIIKKITDNEIVTNLRKIKF